MTSVNAFPGRWRQLMVEFGSINIHETWRVIPSLKALFDAGVVEEKESELGSQWARVSWKGNVP